MADTDVIMLRAANERQVINAFRVQRALTLKSAQPLSALGVGASSETLRGMLVAGTVRRAGPERYYLDERLLASQRQLSGRTVFRVALGIIAVATAVALYRFL
jgi:hypothetical protein